MNSAKALETQRWAALPERGTPGALRFILWFAARVGRTSMRFLLYPIAAYFAATAHPARLASLDYLRRVHSRAPHWWNVFGHFYCFATTILDRVYLLRSDFSRFSITIHGRDLLHRQLETGKGCVLLGSHLGSFEVLRALGVSQQRFPIKVLMDIDHNQNLTSFLDALNPAIAATASVATPPRRRLVRVSLPNRALSWGHSCRAAIPTQMGKKIRATGRIANRDTSNNR